MRSSGDMKPGQYVSKMNLLLWYGTGSMLSRPATTVVRLQAAQGHEQGDCSTSLLLDLLTLCNGAIQVSATAFPMLPTQPHPPSR